MPFLAALALRSSTTIIRNQLGVEAFHTLKTTTASRASTATKKTLLSASASPSSLLPTRTSPRRTFLTTTTTALSSSSDEADSSQASKTATTTTAMTMEQQQQQKWVQDALYRIRDSNRMPDDIRASLIPFVLDGKVLGKVRPAVAELLVQTTSSENGVTLLVSR